MQVHAMVCEENNQELEEKMTPIETILWLKL